MYDMKKYVFVLVACSVIMTSCVAPKKMIYLKDMQPEQLYSLYATELRIQPDDRLKIVVSSRQPELSAPFNLGVGGYQVGADGEVRSTSYSAARENSYLVDLQGNIEFPIFGTIFVEGLTKNELSNRIRERLRTENLINDAIVIVEILNVKVVVMGEVRNVGIHSFSNYKITLIEAITRSGGFTGNASWGEVIVLRQEEDGIKKYITDVRTTEIFNSPAFYLQQNDVVYVLPRAAQRTETEARAWQWYNTAFGVIGWGLSTLILLKLWNVI